MFISDPNFKTWYDNADMPTKTFNGWEDLEDGSHYDPHYDYINDKPKNSRLTLPKKALTSRDQSKKVGGKALTGSFRQKEWAENIRAEKLSRMSHEEAVFVCTLNFTGTSRFWIDNRERTAAEIIDICNNELIAETKRIEEEEARVKAYRAKRKAEADASVVKFEEQCNVLRPVVLDILAKTPAEDRGPFIQPVGIKIFEENLSEGQLRIYREIGKKTCLFYLRCEDGSKVCFESSDQRLLI